MQIVSTGDNLHKMSDHVLSEKREKTTINLSSDEYAHRVKVKVFHFLYNLNQCCLAL